MNESNLASSRPSNDWDGSGFDRGFEIEGAAPAGASTLAGLAAPGPGQWHRCTRASLKLPAFGPAGGGHLPLGARAGLANPAPGGSGGAGEPWDGSMIWLDWYASGGNASSMKGEACALSRLVGFATPCLPLRELWVMSSASLAAVHRRSGGTWLIQQFVRQ